MPFSFNNLIGDTKVQLEKASMDKFGAAVEDFAKGGLKDLIGGAKTASGATSTVNRVEKGNWYATSYAAALSSGSDYRPKMKFLFKVEFIFTEEAKKTYAKIFGAPTANDFTFMIKSVDRPKVDFEYEEDVNQYNFRTKALKKIIHRDLTMTIMDDVGNRVFNFFRCMMALHSPVVRNQFNRDGTLDAPKAASLKTGSGMSWLASVGVGQNNAHRNVVNSDFGNSIECIRVMQIFTDPSVGIQDTSQMVSFDFINPRIVSFDLDELSHEANDVNLLTMVFGYDWMEMVNVGSLSAKGKSYTEKSYRVQAKNTTGAPTDITPGPLKGGSGTGSKGLLNDFGGVLNGQLGKYTNGVTKDLISKGVSSIAGNGRLATSIGGSLTNSFSGPISSLVSTKTRDSVGGIISSFKNPFAKASAATVADSTSPTASATTTASVDNINGFV